jgi:hypothetical protein
MPLSATGTSGAAGGALTAIATWPASIVVGAMPPVTGYRVTARNTATGALTVSAVLPATARSLEMTLPAGNYRFSVVAINRNGTSASSLLSLPLAGNGVAAR